MRHRKGFTLIELSIVVVFIGLVFLIGANMFKLSARSLEMGNREFGLQTNVRVAAQTALSKVRYSTAIFTIPQSSFNGTNLERRWDYFGIEETTLNGKPASQIVQYTWNEALGKHKQAIIVEPRENITYSLVFSKDITVSAVSSDNSEIYENNLLNFKIVGYLNADFSNPYITIDGGTLASNSLQVVDYGTDLDNATAIAYRSDERPSTFVGHIAIILDCSGSMAWDMEGNWPDTIEFSGLSRIDTLKVAAKSLLNQLAAHNNISVSLVPFSNSANDPQPFVSTKLENASLISQIDLLSPFGGTNTGDAIRRAYWQLRNETVPPGAIAKNYLIVLVDGDTTYCSINQYTMEDYDLYRLPSASDYFWGDGNIANDYFGLYFDEDASEPLGYLFESVCPVQVIGTGSTFKPYTSGYVEYCGAYFKGTDFAKPYFISLSRSVSQAGINNVVDSLGIQLSNYFMADDLASLNTAFTSIMNDIVNELWHLNGPSL